MRAVHATLASIVLLLALPFGWCQQDAPVLTLSDLKKTLESGEQFLLLRDLAKAKDHIQQAYDSTLRQEGLPDEVRLRAARLKTDLQSQDPSKLKEALVVAERLEPLATSALGDCHRETLLTKALRLGLLLEAGEPRRSEWLALDAVVERCAGTLSATDRMILEYRIAASLFELPLQSVAFDGDVALPIEPQLQFKDEYSSDSLVCIERMRKAVTLGEAISPEMGKAMQARFESMKQWDVRARWDTRQNLIKDARTKLWETTAAEAQTRLRTWRTEHPIPIVWISLSNNSYAYHLADCHTIEDSRDVTSMNVSEAMVRYRRRACQVCDPPGMPIPPNSIRLFEFDGVTYNAEELKP